ncbi:MAG: 2Fe-2S iron-sulfur cluster-binding protein [Gemmatimonadota bacterium]|nr:2Fe-2S iron-sulfur cluster-binding protein [Gemmatimonadota bacterium]MDH4347619.1 2Fe-2S iron-sulfur cluster-binding protein [Gemmatimonadota bacterium]MDH5282927.1 2Fe-2S iron-sulfur cluster-binding protein [Gemmatimonadota bacterium]
MSSDLVSVTIDGVVVQVPKGTPIIEAAKQAGVLVPHYCYHPSLPSPAVCRMCLVEVEKAPKLMPACVTTVADGQVVHTDSEQARKARTGVLEFLLINHPLDCPICDQAGECELQNYVFQEGREGTRYGDYAKRYNPVEDFGPDVLYVANRCILCTRCVRFMDDVAGTPVLNVSERGDRAYIGIDQDQLLDHPWAGNVVDLCPVGSLVSKDFLHKARAWDLDKTASICTGCSQGCNIMIDTRDNTVVRLRPRPNMEVNRHFMCDHGRMNYRWMNRGDRIEAPLVRSGDRHVATDWDQALDLVRGLVGQAGPAVILASGGASLESLGMLKGMLAGRPLTAAVQVPLADAEAPLAGVPNLALRKERAANGEGARLLGYSMEWDPAVKVAGKAALVVLLDVALTDAEAAVVAGAGAVVVLGTIESQALAAARVVLPVTNTAEEQGTFVNRDGRVQRYEQARSAPGMGRPAWWIAAEVQGAAAATPAEAFAQVAAAVTGLAGMTYADLGVTGRMLRGASAAGSRV